MLSPSGCNRAMTAPASFSVAQVVAADEFLAVVVIAVHENGEMTSSTAATLVCAAVSSTLCFPLIGLRLRSHHPNGVRGSELATSNVVL